MLSFRPRQPYIGLRRLPGKETNHGPVYPVLRLRFATPANLEPPRALVIIPAVRRAQPFVPTSRVRPERVVTFSGVLTPGFVWKGSPRRTLAGTTPGAQARTFTLAASVGTTFALAAGVATSQSLGAGVATTFNLGAS
jgi:hypothetical protein